MVNKKTFRKSVSLLLLLALLLPCLSACSRSALDAGSKSEYIAIGGTKDENYRTTEAYLGDFSISFEASTKLTSLRVTEIYWPYSGDQYAKVMVSEGDIVQAGQVLAEITVVISEADRLQRELAVTDARSAISQIDTSFSQQIAQANAAAQAATGDEYTLAMSRVDLLYAQYNERLAQAQARLEAAQAALQELEEHEKTTQIIAPYDAFVADIIWNWQEGETVPTWTPIMTVAALAAIAIEVTNTSPYGNVPYLSTVTIVDQKTKQSYSGTVVSCGDVTGSMTDDLVIVPENMEPTMNALRVYGNILDKKNVVLVNSEALKKDGNNYYVLILIGGTSVSKTYVSIGGISNGIAWITDGVQAGDELVLN